MGKTARDVADKCCAIYEVVLAMVREWKNAYVAESEARLVAPEGVSKVGQLTLMLKQPWVKKVRSHKGMRRLPEVCHISGRLYTQERADNDREMKFPDAPPPTPGSAGHGLESDKDCRGVQQKQGERKDTNYVSYAGVTHLSGGDY